MFETKTIKELLEFLFMITILYSFFATLVFDEGMIGLLISSLLAGILSGPSQVVGWPKHDSFDHYLYALLEGVCTTELLYAIFENFTCFAPEITPREEYNSASNIITRSCVRVIQKPTRAKL